jgi:hypothetical protein
MPPTLHLNSFAIRAPHPECATSSILFSNFDLDHWLKVKAERARLGIERRTAKGVALTSHPLVGRTVVDTSTGKAYMVENVKKDWLQGWFLTALMNENGSHRVCVVDVLKCENPGILSEGHRFQTYFSPCI